MASNQMVTVLFTDMVGSTELSSKLSSEDADELRQNHFSLLRQALAASDGTEVKNLGDGLMAVFSSPSAAVICAVTMQQAVEQNNRRADTPIGLRVGLSGGEATIEEGDYFGDPVVEAARLCTICEGGQILVADLVRVMSGRRSSHTFRDLGEQELKGLPDPVAICEVEWEPVAASSGIPLPERLEVPSNALLFGFVGRGAEVERLAERVKNAVDGNRSVSFLSGEPGIGKTSLCRKLARIAHEQGICVLYGRCDEDLSVSYQPFAEALGHLVTHCDEALLRDHVSEYGGALLSLVGQLSRRMPDLPPTQSTDPDSERLRLFSAVVSLFDSAAADQGLLLVIDDLHWADKASLQLLRHVVGSTQVSKIMIVGTYRDSDLSSGHPLTDTLATLTREADFERIDLMGLEDFEIIQMMEFVAGHEMDRDGVELAHAVRRETEGNAFFATELLRHLAETGLVHQDDSGRWVASEDLYERGLPQSVRAVVGQRVDRLGEETRKVLSQAAVIGRDFDITVLSSVSDMGEDDLLDLIDEAVRAGLLTEMEEIVGRFSFAHALMQHTLYEDLGAARRARIHRKTADVLEHLYGEAPRSHAAELARHFVSATKAADATKALTYCKLAGEEALVQLAPADALGWFAQALDLYSQIPIEESLHCDLLIGLGTAQRRTGDPKHRQTLLDAAAIASSLGDRDRLVAAALANSRGSATTTGQVDNDKVDVLERALEASGTGDSADRAHLLAILAAELPYDTDRARWSEVAGQAMAMARRLDDPMCFLRVASVVYAGVYLPDTLDDRLADLSLTVALAEKTGDIKAGLEAHLNRAIACLQSADRPGLDLHLDAAGELAERLGEPFERWQQMTMQSMRSLLSGDLDRSEREAQIALAVAGQSAPEAMPAFGAQMLEVLRIRGQWSGVEEMAELMAAAAEEHPGLPVLRAGLARTYCDLGRDEAANPLIDNDVSNGFADFPLDTTWMAAMCTMSEVCVHLGRADGAATIYDRLVPWHAQVSTAWATAQGPVAYHLGTLATLLGRVEDAERHLSHAVDIAERLGAPWWTALARLELATLIRESGNDRDGRSMAMITSALDSAKRHGFGALVETIEALRF